MSSVREFLDCSVTKSVVPIRQELVLYAGEMSQEGGKNVGPVSLVVSQLISAEEKEYLYHLKSIAPKSLLSK